MPSTYSPYACGVSVARWLLLLRLFPEVSGSRESFSSVGSRDQSRAVGVDIPLKASGGSDNFRVRRDQRENSGAGIIQIPGVARSAADHFLNGLPFRDFFLSDGKHCRCAFMQILKSIGKVAIANLYVKSIESVRSHSGYGQSYWPLPALAPLSVRWNSRYTVAFLPTLTSKQRSICSVSNHV